MQDLLYHILPLNHLHGIVVALLTTLWAGATVELVSKLDGEQESFDLALVSHYQTTQHDPNRSGADGSTRRTCRLSRSCSAFQLYTVRSPVLLQVRSDYFCVLARLLSAYDALSEAERREASRASARLRLQVSGSAPLPEGVKRRWDEEVGGGQILLERYGMTETYVSRYSLSLILLKYRLAFSAVSRSALGFTTTSV